MTAYLITVLLTIFLIGLVIFLSTTKTDFPDLDIRELTVGNLLSILLMSFIPILNVMVSILCTIISTMIVWENIEWYLKHTTFSVPNKLMGLLNTKIFKK